MSNVPTTASCRGETHRTQSSSVTAANKKTQAMKRLIKPLARPQVQYSPLLSLPMEIKQRIYDLIFTDWSLAIFDAPGIHQEHQLQQRQQRLDETVLLRPCGSKMLSGPPGCNLMLACRDTYIGVQDRYGSGFTGKLILGNVKGRLQSTLGLYLSRQSKLQQWYEKVHSLFVSFSINISKLNFRIEAIFPNLRFVNTSIYSTRNELLQRPLSRIAGTILRGEYDTRIAEIASVATHAFLGKVNPLTLTQHGLNFVNPVGGDHVTVDIKVVHWMSGRSDYVLGFHCRWEPSPLKVISRAIRETDSFRFWEDGMFINEIVDIDLQDQYNSSIPDRFKWLQIEDAGFLSF